MRMSIEVTPCPLQGVLLIRPRVFPDDRGCFLETYHREKYSAAGIDWNFVQDNHSHSRRNVIRGMHYQLRRPQGKLIYAVRGEILDVVVDLRRSSPSFGRAYGVTLSDSNRMQLLVPPGFAHGFCVTSDTADVTYKCTDFYVPDDEYGVLWSSVPVEWPTSTPVVSPKDQAFPAFSEIPADHLPR